MARRPGCASRGSWMAVLLSCYACAGAAVAAPPGESVPAGEPVGARVEKWADRSLPVKGALSLWLDASRQPAAWNEHGRPGLGNGNEVDVWYDASGLRHDFAQAVRAARPRFLAGPTCAAVRFDGENDYLQSRMGRGDVGEFTLVLAVAPRSNGGGFRGCVAAAEAGRNDFQSGFTVDLGAYASVSAMDQLNVEGAGFMGYRSLMSAPAAFRQVHTIVVTGGAAGVEGIQAFVDGQATGRRERGAGPVRMDQAFVGARTFSDGMVPPFVQGFLDGDVAEVMLYERQISPEERGQLTAYLTRKYAGYGEELSRVGEEGERLKSLENPPDVQVLVPGFTARQLPVDLTNINNVRYREDGKLVAVAYDGNVYVLSDTDGDGLEDRAELFWDNKGRVTSPIGMALTPPGYKLGHGVFVASKGKVSLLLDADGDGKAEKEVVVAEGWAPLPHMVDALGVAVGPDGSVYFGLGTTNFANGYLLDKEGKAKYRTSDERGTIMKVAPDFKKREILCTGIRFPVALAFNRDGDLFATDQEGATWLPNGNPFDELLHILPGRHYGFPPRHPKHLPDVVDEPSVFDYGPQHQSTCGLTFDEPVNGGGPVFGPAWWRGDALVCGESRGKLYRTQVAKTPAGYVARNQLLASLTMLTIDCCVSPAGDLVVATHGGQPDWGSGPQGHGRLYKIGYRGKDGPPQPVSCWAAGPTEVRVTFDRELDAEFLGRVTKNVSVEYGRYVAAGDRFEKIRPGYAVVQSQMNEPRRKLSVGGVQVTADRRTLVLSTERHPYAAGYAVTFDGLDAKPTGKDEIAQLGAIDLAYDLTGVAVAWQGTGSERWAGWLPHPDPKVAAAFTAGSADHDALWRLIKTPGQMTMRTSLDLSGMLRPAVQPGSTLDYTPSREEVTVTFESGVPIDVRCAGAEPRISTTPEGKMRVTLTTTPKAGELLPLEIDLPTGKGEPALTVSFSTKEDARPRAMQVRRFLLPWARVKPASKGELAREETPQLKGGSWLRGREVFYGTQAGCSKCHQVRGVGGDLGPDLSNLVHRDYDSVLRDIRQPSGAMNPDYIPSTVRMKDGRVLQGIVRGVDRDHFVVRGDAAGEATPLSRDQVEKVSPSPISVMPEGLDKALGEEKMRDLLTFLLTEPLAPAALERDDAPPPRTRAEVTKAIAASAPATRPSAAVRPLNVVLAAGPKDHGPSEHDYPDWQRRWSTLLGLANSVTVSQAEVWPTPEQWSKADVVVFYSANPAWSAEKAKDLDAFLNRGGGVVVLHFAVNGQAAVEALAERIGLAWRNGVSKFRHGPVDLTISDTGHPITRGLGKVRFVDESYWDLVGDVGRVHVLAGAVEEGVARPLLWTVEQGRGRVFACILGHYAWTFDDPLYRLLVLRGVCWTAGETPDRLNDLVTVGARVRD